MKHKLTFPPPLLYPCPVLSILVPTSFELENHTNYTNIYMYTIKSMYLATSWVALPLHTIKLTHHWSMTPRP